VKKTYPDLPTWEFEMDEVSANVYEVTGRDATGHTVSAKGTDLDSLLERCRMEARKMSTLDQP
jgi:hypothetical protein